MQQIEIFLSNYRYKVSDLPKNSFPHRKCPPASPRLCSMCGQQMRKQEGKGQCPRTFFRGGLQCKTSWKKERQGGGLLPAWGGLARGWGDRASGNRQPPPASPLEASLQDFSSWPREGPSGMNTKSGSRQLSSPPPASPDLIYTRLKVPLCFIYK